MFFMTKKIKHSSVLGSYRHSKRKRKNSIIIRRQPNCFNRCCWCYFTQILFNFRICYLCSGTFTRFVLSKIKLVSNVVVLETASSRKYLLFFAYFLFFYPSILGRPHNHTFLAFTNTTARISVLSFLRH